MQEDVYTLDIRKFKNTDKFREASIHFEKYGYYTSAPRGTTAYYEYWDEETRRCLYGYEAKDGESVTGYHYFYLNYCKISKSEIDPITGKPVKIMGFPKFYDYDYTFFKTVEEAERQGKHLCVLKARRKGYSYKISAMLIRNYYLIPASNSFAYASEKEFLIKDGILTKAWDYLDFVDENTAWSKKRQKVDQIMHKRASYVYDIDGVKTEGGFKSNIVGVTLKNDPQKARGKAGKLIIFEEAGKFQNLKVAWNIAKSSVEQGSDVFGLMICFGTGGTVGSDFEGLRDIFYEPGGYGCLKIKNIWDEGAQEPCGFFVPDYYNYGNEYMDSEGNSLVSKAMKVELDKRRDIISTATDRSTIDRHIAEHCFTGQEATLQLTGNIFPKEEIKKHLAYIRNTQSIRNQKQVGRLYYDDNGLLSWEPSEKPKDLTKYRLDKETDRSGEIVIWEHPIDNPPYGLYIAGIDPYDHDKSQTDSLGSTFIYKRFQDFESYYDMIVAEYTGRPETADDYYENVMKLLKYYNAKALYENEKKGLFQYLTTKNCEYLLADQPDIISDIIQVSKVQRKKGIHMNQQIKDWGEIKIKEYLLEDRGDGKLGLHTILSEPLLEELMLYNDKGNFDRVMSFMMVIIYRQELHKVHIKNKEEEVFNNLIFPDGVYIENSYKNLYEDEY
jgi:hypothetical protein